MITGPQQYKCMSFLYSHHNCFWGFLQIVKQQIGNTSKIGYNWIFIAKIVVKMDEKTNLKRSQNGLVQSEWKYFFLRFQMFVFSLEYAEKH